MACFNSSDELASTSGYWPQRRPQRGQALFVQQRHVDGAAHGPGQLVDVFGQVLVADAVFLVDDHRHGHQPVVPELPPPAGRMYTQTGWTVRPVATSSGLLTHVMDCSRAVRP